jgi:mannose-1-phosphate guanylyltransferase
MIHSDIFSDLPLRSLERLYEQKQSLGVVVTTKVQSHHDRYGQLIVEEETGRVIHFSEKPESYISDTINAGIYLFSNNIFSILQEEEIAKS